MLIEVPEVVFVENRAAWKQGRETKRFAECHPGRREASLALGQKLARPVNQSDTHRACLRVRVHEREALPECVFLYQGVWVQNKYVLPRRLPYCLIVGNGKSGIICINNQFYLREAFAYHAYGVVHGVVVNHPDFTVNALQGTAYRAKRLLQKVADVIVDDDN
jgi:hypothetical protein